MTRKLNQTMFAGMSAFLAAGALSSVAAADVTVGRPSVLTVNMATTDDLARVNGTGQDASLRKTDEEFTNEMHVAAFNGTAGLSIEMRSGSLMINGQLTKPGGNGARMQGACVPLKLAQAADGSVAAEKLPGEAFLTANNGNEYRNFNHPEVDALSEGTATQPALFLVKYNAQINGNDTKSYGVVVDQNCKIIPTKGGQNGQAAATAANPGVVLIAKNNDDCSMNQDGKSGIIVKRAADDFQKIQYAGCNGNGNDDGWVNSFSVKITRDANGLATGATVVKHGDVSVNKNEERGRGTVLGIASDPNFVVTTFTSGNNQPQRDGTWISGLDITPGKQPTILWTKQVEGRKQLDLGAGKTANTYSSRIMAVPVLDANLQPTDQIIIRTGDLQGNNQNNRKGGKYLTFQTSVLTVGRAAPPAEIKMTNLQSLTKGTDGTHLVMAPALLGAAATPGVIFMQGNHTGVAQSATMRMMTVVNGKIEVETRTASVGAAYDEHLYSNYLGNNPGNQGRSFATAFAMKNPFYGQNGNKDKVLLVATTNGKDATQQLSNLKPSTYVSVTPVVSDAPAAGQSGSGTGAGNTGDSAGTDSDSSVGGCSSSSGTGGIASLLLLGLVAIRRRRA
jgi:uncharacterized protein (TIGR03382 family)